jgi:hypothetical protein
MQSVRRQTDRHAAGLAYEMTERAQKKAPRERVLGGGASVAPVGGADVQGDLRKRTENAVTAITPKQLIRMALQPRLTGYFKLL